MVPGDSVKGRGIGGINKRGMGGLDGGCGLRSNAAMSNGRDAYRELVTELREVALFGSIGSVLGWDERVLMPPKGADHRANQSSLLARKVHEKFTSPRIGELLATVETAGLNDANVAVNVRETRRQYDRATKLPSSLVEEMAK